MSSAKSPFIPRDITNNGTSKQATLARNTLAIVSTVPILFLTHSGPWKAANLPLKASQGASTVMVLVASSCLVTLPKSTAVTASWNGPSKPNVIVAELPDVDI